MRYYLNPIDFEKAFFRLKGKTFFGYRNAMAFSFLYGCGLRREECRFLKMSDLSMDRSLIRVFGKRKEVRYVPVDQFTFSFLMDYLEMRDSWLVDNDQYNEFVFCGKDCQPLPALSLFYEITNAINKVAGSVVFCRLHDLRHAYALNLISSGTALVDVQAFLGHRHLSTTAVYLSGLQKSCWRDVWANARKCFPLVQSQ